MKHIGISLVLTFAVATAHAADNFTCTYEAATKLPPLKLTSDGMMQFGKEKPTKADGFKMDDADTQFFIARPDGQHFIGFDQLTGKGSDSIENSGKHVSYPLTCKKL